MEYTERKICELLNFENDQEDLRCPQLFNSSAIIGSSCNGCQLFETFMKFKERSIEFREQSTR